MFYVAILVSLRIQVTRQCYFGFAKRGDIYEMQSHAHNQLKHHISQPLFKLTTSSVSHSPITSGSYFASPNKSASHGHQLNIRPVNSPSNNYFRPSTPRQKEKGDLYKFKFILTITICLSLCINYKLNLK